MKATLLIILIFAAAFFLTGCGHYGMGMGGHHYYNQTFSHPRHMNENSPGTHSPYMDGNSIQSENPNGRY